MEMLTKMPEYLTAYYVTKVIDPGLDYGNMKKYVQRVKK
jgi:hypothetical protein